jgi:hypothetical protein
LKKFSKFKLEKLILLLLVIVAVLFICYAFPVYYSTLQVQAQQVQEQPQSPPMIGVKITSPMTGREVSAGELKITGTSTDKTTTDCTVYADWNDQKPFQKAVATGPGGANDYSNWTFTYTDKYHLITNGTNNLTSKLSCIDHNNNNANLTKWYSVDIIGISSDQNQQHPLSITDNSIALGNSTTTAVIAGGGENEGIKNVLPTFSDSKDCKDSKDSKDCKDSKDSKSSKDSKDSKSSKDSKDSKSSKDSKGIKAK